MFTAILSHISHMLHSTVWHSTHSTLFMCPLFKKVNVPAPFCQWNRLSQGKHQFFSILKGKMRWNRGYRPKKELQQRRSSIYFAHYTGVSSKDCETKLSVVNSSRCDILKWDTLLTLNTFLQCAIALLARRPVSLLAPRSRKVTVCENELNGPGWGGEATGVWSI